MAPALLAALLLAASPAWSVSLSSRGGVSGHGLGSLEVDDRGAARLVTARGRRCTADVRGPELRALADAVRRARPERWARGAPARPGRPDGVRVELEVRKRRGSGRAAWSEPGDAPPGAVAVAEAARRVLRQARCTAPDPGRATD